MPPISIELALLAGRAVFLVFCFVLAAVTFTRWRRAADRGTSRLSEQAVAVLERITALEAQLAAIRASQGELAEKLSSFSGPVGSPAAPSYQVAIRMARGGATSEELVSSCGLTRREADLVQRLHAPAARARIAAVS